MKYPVVHRAIRSLRDLGWIKVTGKELTVKNVKSIKYGLTAEGVLWLLSKRPKEVPPSVFEETWNRDAIDDHSVDKASESEVKELAPEEVKAKARARATELTRKKIKEPGRDFVGEITTQEDVHMHLLFELDIDRIAEKNTDLFPTVFGPWAVHKRASMLELAEFSLPDLAFSTLTEYYMEYEGLLRKYGTLEQVFAYKFYQKIIENSASVGPDMERAGFVVEGESVKQTLEWMNDVSKAFAQVSTLYKDIVLELEERLALSHSFIKKVACAIRLLPTRNGISDSNR